MHSYLSRVLRHHVTGAIERGEAVPIVEVPVRPRYKDRLSRLIILGDWYVYFAEKAWAEGNAARYGMLTMRLVRVREEVEAILGRDDS